MQPVKYVAEVAPVKEVILHGRADLAYWQERLARENLEPLAADGQAQLLINATEMRFWGILFRESIVGIQVQPTAGMPEGMPAMYLLQAWNSLSAFAWVERNMFSTPYAAGNVKVESKSPVKMQIAQQGQTLIQGAMATNTGDALRITAENWHGVVFLPRRSSAQQMFISKLTGETANFPFRAGSDSFDLTRSPQCETIGQLIDSHFTPQAWAIRQAAAHAKSKTYRVAQFFAR